MHCCQSRDTRRFFIDFGIVLHGARPKRVHGGVDTHVALRDARKVANDFCLTQLGQFVEFITAEQMGGELRGRYIAGRQTDADAPRSCQFKYGWFEGTHVYSSSMGYVDVWIASHQRCTTVNSRCASSVCAWVAACAARLNIQASRSGRSERSRS